MGQLIYSSLALIVIDPWLLFMVGILALVVISGLMWFPEVGLPVFFILFCCMVIFIAGALSYDVFGWPTIHFIQIKEMYDTPVKITLNTLKSNTHVT